MLPQVGLYYPFIHFRDERWLKTAALYWRELARVVPRGYPLADSRTARVLCEELGFVRPVDPAETARQVAPLFLSVLARHGGALRAAGYAASPAWGAWGRHSAGDSFNPAPPLTWGRAARHNRVSARAGVAASYEEEFTPELREVLMECGLAADVRRTPGLQERQSLVYGRWMAMDARLTWVYKCAFVEVLARQGRYTPTTDQPDAHLASDGWDADRIAQSLLDAPGVAPAARPDDLTDAVGLLAIRLAVPAGMDNIPVEKIVKLRQEHREEFAAFNAVVAQTVEELRQELSGVTLQEARVRDVRLAVEDRFDRPLQALRKAMRAQGMGTVYGLANVKFDVPALMSLAGTAAGGFLDHPVAGAAAGAALGFMNVRHTHKQQVQGLKSANPAAYLLSVQRGLKPQSLLRQITQRA